MEALVQSWLDRQCRVIEDISCGVVLLGGTGPESLSPVASWPAGSAPPAELLSAANAALTDRAAVINGHPGSNHTDSHKLDTLACPLAVGDRVIGFVVVATTCRTDTGQHAIMQLLKWGNMWLELLVEQKFAVARQSLAVLDSITLYHVVGGNGTSPDIVADAAVERALVEHLELEADLRHAVEHGELELHYKPRINLQSEKIAGMEALLRWHHPEIGIIPSAQLIPAAEAAGLTTEIWNWVLRNACIQIKGWHDAGHREIRIAVNLSAAQFQQAGLLELVSATLLETGVDPRYLDLEITESTLMGNIDAAARTLRILHQAGIHLSIDDFGTGYSSLHQLRRFPISMVKINRTLVRDIAVDTDAAVIIRSIVDMAHSLGLRVIAKGVEITEQRSMLRDIGCDEIQGYFISPAVPPEAAEELLRNDRDATTTNTRAIS
ncbi:MAG: EAL domain-containing protein [Gammaproteobacteria bacterium]|nr:EAL domain-containing protein [Gammaproteobacteria bacterium]